MFETNLTTPLTETKPVAAFAGALIVASIKSCAALACKDTEPFFAIMTPSFELNAAIFAGLTLTEILLSIGSRRLISSPPPKTTLPFELVMLPLLTTCGANKITLFASKEPEFSSVANWLLVKLNLSFKKSWLFICIAAATMLSALTTELFPKLIPYGFVKINLPFAYTDPKISDGALPWTWFSTAEVVVGWLK